LTAAARKERERKPECRDVLNITTTRNSAGVGEGLCRLRAGPRIRAARTNAEQPVYCTSVRRASSDSAVSARVVHSIRIGYCLGLLCSLASAALLWYELGMKGVAKVAVSIPTETLRSLERVRTRLRKTRSAVVTEAIERWLAAGEVGEEDRRYVEGYLRHPEPSADVASIASAVVQSWEPWE
jgi:hypothetical protein